MKRTCALCGFRDSSGWTEHDGRHVPACTTCQTPQTARGDLEEILAVPGGSVRFRAVQAVLANPGVGISTVAECLGLDLPIPALRAGLHGAVKTGILRRSGGGYYPTGKMPRKAVRYGRSRPMGAQP